MDSIIAKPLADSVIAGDFPVSVIDHLENSARMVSDITADSDRISVLGIMGSLVIVDIFNRTIVKPPGFLINRYNDSMICFAGSC